MKKLLAAAMLMLLWSAAARAENVSSTENAQSLSEEVGQVVGTLDLSAWQSALDEAGAPMDADDILQALTQGDAQAAGEGLARLAESTLTGEAGRAGKLLLMLLAPMVLSVIVRQSAGKSRGAEAAEWICFLTGAGMMLGVFGEELERAQAAVGRIGRLTEQVFPVLTALMSASGKTGTAGLMQPLVSFGGGALTAFVQSVMGVLGGSAAVLAAAGNLSEHLPLRGLFKLCCSAGNWLLGGVMVIFIGMTTLGGVIGSAQDGMTLRAAKYAAGSLLPVVGGDIAGTMDTMVYSAGLVRQAAGVTGVIVMLGMCMKPIIRLMVTMLTYMTACALAEPLSDGALRRCMEQMSGAVRLLLACALVSAALFITLTGVCLNGAA